MKKRILAIVLTIAMLVSFMPFSVLNISAANDYASGVEGDTASYALKIPATADKIDATWGIASSALGRDPDGVLGTAGGYIDVAHIDGENFLAYQVKSGEAGSMKINAASKTYGQAKGVPESIDLTNTTALAVRIKIDCLAENYEDKSSFNISFDGASFSQITGGKEPLFLDKETGNLIPFYWGGRRGDKTDRGFDTQGSLDGYMILPLQHLYKNSEEYAADADFLRSAYEGFEIEFYATGVDEFNSASNWDNKVFYLGDAFFIDDVVSFANARTDLSYAVKGAVGAYYAIRLPRVAGMIGPYAGSAHARTGRNLLDTDFQANKALHLDVIDGDLMIEIQTKADADGTVKSSNSIGTGGNTYLGYKSSNTTEDQETRFPAGTLKGIPAEVPASSLEYLAIRIAATAGTGADAVFTFYHGNERIGGNNSLEKYIVSTDEDNGAKYSIKFFDKTSNVTYETYGDANSPVQFKFGSDFTIKGAIDGWLLIPLKAYGVNEGTSRHILGTEANARANWAGLAAWLDHGDWANRSFYVGDMYFVEDPAVFTKSIGSAKVEVDTVEYEKITLKTEEGAVYSIDGGKTWNDTGIFEGLTNNTEYEIWAKYSVSEKITKVTVKTLDRTPYSTHLGDSASKVVTLPREEKVVNHNDYLQVGIGGNGYSADRIAENAKSSVNLVNLNGEYFFKGVAPDTVSTLRHVLTLRGDYHVDNYLATKTTTATIFDDATGIDMTNLKYFAFRLKIEGGESNSCPRAAVRIQLNGAYRTVNIANGYTTYFLDLKNNKLEKYNGKDTAGNSTVIQPYDGDVRFNGQVDGWLLLPFEAFKSWSTPYTDVSEIKSQIKQNVKTISFEYINMVNKTYSDWTNKTLYVGDVLAVEDVATFASVRMAEGACGENATFGFDAATGKLTISGTGAMKDGAPWDVYASKVTSLEIADGITEIKANAFASLTNLASVIVPESVYSIGDTAFPANTVIIGVVGSTAADYAANNGYTFKNYCDEVGHAYAHTVTPPTCSADGYTEHLCSICGHSYTDGIIPATGIHAMETVVTTEPTCTEPGAGYIACSICWEGYQDIEVEPKGHNHVGTVVAPTETEQGYTLYECTDCDDSYKADYTEATGGAPEANFTAVDKTTAGAKRLGIGMFHFNTKFTTNTGSSKANVLAEFEAVLAQGYVNTVFLAGSETYFEDAVKLAVKYGCDIWYSAQAYDSDTQLLSYYIATVEANVNKILATEGAADLFLGFYWDEPILKGMTSDDFVTMTKTLYERWGKRNFPVFGTKPLVDGIITAETLQYVTDVAWDNYGFDFSEAGKTDAEQNEYLAKISKEYGETFETAEEFFVWFYQTKLLAKFDHEVNVWYYPGAYATWLWTEARADEELGKTNLKFFDELLYSNAKPGGLMLYTYMNSSTNADEKGLSSFLDVPNATNDGQLMHTATDKWVNYSNILKSMVTRYNDTYVVPVVDVPFGSLNIVNKTTTTITYTPVAGIEYSIDGGKTWETDGVFDGLTAATGYTITVKNAAGDTKDFAVATRSDKPYASEVANDTASYAYKVPELKEISGSPYATVHARLGGKAAIVDVNGEKMLEVKKTQHDGDAYVKLMSYPSTYPEYSVTAKGIPADIDNTNLTAMAIRMKIDNAAADSVAGLRLHAEGSGTNNTANAPVLFVDKATGEITTIEYVNGFRLVGELDGWLIVPFDAYPAAKRKDWHVANFTGFDIWMCDVGSGNMSGNSDITWADKTLYIGDSYFVEDVEAFAAAHKDEVAVDPRPVVTATENANRGAHIEWTAVENATKYYVYQRAAGTEAWTYKATLNSDVTSYDTAKLNAGSYEFSVIAIATIDGVSTTLDRSEPATLTIAPFDVNVKAESSKAGALITWDAQPNARRYYVYQREAGGSWKSIAVVLTNSYQTYKIPNGNYEFTVIVEYDINGVISQSEASVAAPLTIAYNANVKAEVSKAGALLTWDADPLATKYYVYQREVGAAKWQCIAAALTNEYQTYKLRENVNYEYTVVAQYDVRGVLVCTDGSTGTASLTLPRYNANIVIEAYQNGFKATWDHDEKSNKYYFYYRKAGTSKWYILATSTVGEYTLANMAATGEYEFTLVTEYNTRGALICTEASVTASFTK